MDKLYILCRLEVLLPDDGDIDQVGYLTSSSPKYVNKPFTKL